MATHATDPSCRPTRVSHVRALAQAWASGPSGSGGEMYSGSRRAERAEHGRSPRHESCPGAVPGTGEMAELAEQSYSELHDELVWPGQPQRPQPGTPAAEPSYADVLRDTLVRPPSVIAARRWPDRSQRPLNILPAPMAVCSAQHPAVLAFTACPPA